MEMVTLSNLAAYSAQVAAIVALATVLARVLRIDTPGVRYGYWRAVFVLCLVLPLIQGRQVPSTAAGSPSTAAVDTHLAIAADAAPRAATPSFDPSTLIASVLIAGIGCRMLWLVISFSRLRRLRRLGNPADQ